MAVSFRPCSLAKAELPLPPSQPKLDLSLYPNLRLYDLGTATLSQTGVGQEFQAMPVPLTGVIGFPAGAGPFPIVVILHGRHGGCHFAAGGESQWPCRPGTETRYDVGFAYLAQRLTEAGYGILIPNLNGAFANAFGATPETRNQLADQRSQQIIDHHLTRLASADHNGSTDFGLSVQGRVDWSALAMVGHSMGGGAAALSALNRQGHRSAEAMAEGLGPVAALLLVSPTRSHPIVRQPRAYQLPDVPTAVLMGGCDRDITDFSSLYYFEMADQDAHRRTLAAAVVLLGANHNFFNAAVGEDDYYRRADNRALCHPQRSRQRLSRVAQETFLTQYTQDFLAAVLRPVSDSEAHALLGLAPGHAAPSHLYTWPVLTNLASPGASRYTVFRASPTPATYQPSSNLALTLCQPLSPCGNSPRPQPQFPAMLKLHWRSPGEFLRFPLSHADVGQFDSLQLRLAAEPRANASSLQLAITLHDQAGQATRVDIPASAPALFQFVPTADSMPNPPTVTLTGPINATSTAPAHRRRVTSESRPSGSRVSRRALLRISINSGSHACKVHHQASSPVPFSKRPTRTC
ncbi:MAG: hypothetical protein HC929_23170 [Leptolyngbyaceae cyanobacterium SM2_5_2]|nr:hypothetical protein [Leptolyngbyaceae cyanobacterium SM2_5_2]